MLEYQRRMFKGVDPQYSIVIVFNVDEGKNKVIAKIDWLSYKEKDGKEWIVRGATLKDKQQTLDPKHVAFSFDYVFLYQSKE